VVLGIRKFASHEPLVSSLFALLRCRSVLLLDHSIRSRQHYLRNRQPYLLGRLEIDQQLELCWLLHGQFGRSCALQYFIHVSGRVPI
jgi:hypothetical protein